MSWENEDFASSSAIVNKFAGEDEEEILDAWDAEEEPVQKPVAPVKKIEIPKSKLLQKELKEKELKNQLPNNQKLTEKENQNLDKDREYEMFKDAFDIKPKKITGIDEFSVKTKDDFEKFNELLSNKILPLETNANYGLFLENLFRKLTVSSDVNLLKKFSTMFNVLANEKTKTEKAVAKKKKGPKAKKLVMENDTTNYDDTFDFDDEF